MTAGHVLIDGDGDLLSVDRAFCDIMRSDPDALIGRKVMDVTAPADRAECAVAIATLRATLRPFRISKRLVRTDRSLVRVTNTVSMLDDGSGAGLMVATIDPITEPDPARAPARLLDSARFLVALRRDRASIFDRSLFSDTAWDAILAAYIAEAEGCAIDAETLAARLEISVNRAERWVAVLIGENVIEIETRLTDPYAARSFRLTAATHARLEAHLAKADRRTKTAEMRFAD